MALEISLCGYDIMRFQDEERVKVHMPEYLAAFSVITKLQSKIQLDPRLATQSNLLMWVLFSSGSCPPELPPQSSPGLGRRSH